MRVEKGHRCQYRTDKIAIFVGFLPISRDGGHRFQRMMGAHFAGWWAGLVGKMRIRSPSEMKEGQDAGGRWEMRQIRDILRLKFAQGLSERQIAASLGLGKGSVGGYVRRAQQSGLA